MTSEEPRRSLRVRKGGGSSLASLPEDDVLEPTDQSPPLSPAYIPDRDAQKKASNETPQKRKRKIESSIAENQRKFAREADPHEGRCLITNRSVAVQTCHLVARATDDTIMTQLEYAWGIPYHELHLDTRYNLCFLRSDWHATFDASPPMWVLIPTKKDLVKLKSLTLGNSRNPAKLRRVFKAGRRYEYRVLPLTSMKEPICRYPDVHNVGDFQHHVRPYKNLGPLLSHVRPQYVVVNSAQKLRRLPLDEVETLAETLAEISSVSDAEAISIIHLITTAYAGWLRLTPADGFIRADAAPRRPESDNGDDRDEDDEGGHSHGEASQPDTGPMPDADLFDEEESDDEEGAESPTSSRDGQNRADLQSEDCTSSSSISESGSISSLQSPSEASTYSRIVDWKQECEAASESGWHSILDQIDDQSRQYSQEPVRCMPHSNYWKKWKPYWRRDGNDMENFFETSQFSSNDWAAREGDTFLPRFLGRCR